MWDRSSFSGLLKSVDTYTITCDTGAVILQDHRLTATGKKQGGKGLVFADMERLVCCNSPPLPRLSFSPKSKTPAIDLDCRCFEGVKHLPVVSRKAA